MQLITRCVWSIREKKGKKKHSPAEGYTDGAYNIGLTSGNDAL